ncbi:kinase-like domain-containing protein [Aspergillus cavernicola]|uniref:non-specific serine/threonine protein kinase n=1 Tax=Aspergillus cavernicola TaxID=176166 RepID=A0ABR4IFY9_9EURO
MEGDQSSCDSVSGHSHSLSTSRSLSISSSTPSSKAIPIAIVEPIEYYTQRRFHPIHLMDRFHETRYIILRKLGHGSFSTVWLAKDTRYDARYVALKVGRAESSESPSEEIKIYNRLPRVNVLHPGRDHYLDLQDNFRLKGPNGSHQVLVYQPMGPSVCEVQEKVVADGRFPLLTAKSILWQTLLGLDFLLDNGIVHGDVQPRNLLFGLRSLAGVPVSALYQDQDIPLISVLPTQSQGGVKLPDYLVPANPLMQHFDLSRPFRIKISDLGGSFLISNPPSAPSPPLHLRGPETLFQRRISAHQDMWSFGCLVFEFITGVTLFDLSDFAVSGITDEMHFIDMYNILGFPKDEALRDIQWPGWRKFFGPTGTPMNHYVRERARDHHIIKKPVTPIIDQTLDETSGLGGTVIEGTPCIGEPLRYTLEQLLDNAIGETVPPGELETMKNLLRGLLKFDPDQRFTTKDVIRHKWFSTFGSGV